MIKYAVISDIHLGHRRNPTHLVVKNTMKWLEDLDDRYPKGIEYLFLAGDITDSLLDCSGDEVNSLIHFTNELINYCLKRRIKLRILEGTPLHDWNQMRILNSIKKVRELMENDTIRYIEDLSIEINEDMSILYVPDEWSTDCADTLEQVKVLLKEHNLAQVDIAIMHGQFSFQLPDFIDESLTHNEVEYLKIVKHYISIGHIHTHKVFDRIIGQGSLDRLAFNEEEPKGGCVLEIKGKEDQWWFYENKDAMIFKTIDISDTDIETLHDVLDKEISQYPIGSHIRLQAPIDHIGIVGFNSLRRRYLDYVLSKKVIGKENKAVKKVSLKNKIAYEPIALTKDNIKPLLLDECSFSDDDTVIAEEILDSKLKEDKN